MGLKDIMGDLSSMASGLEQSQIEDQEVVDQRDYKRDRAEADKVWSRGGEQSEAGKGQEQEQQPKQGRDQTQPEQEQPQQPQQSERSSDDGWER